MPHLSSFAVILTQVVVMCVLQMESGSGKWYCCGTVTHAASYQRKRVMGLAWVNVTQMLSLQCTHTVCDQWHCPRPYCINVAGAVGMSASMPQAITSLHMVCKPNHLWLSEPYA